MACSKSMAQTTDRPPFRKYHPEAPRPRIFLLKGILRLAPEFDGGDSLVWIGGPREGHGGYAIICNEAVDNGINIDEGVEDAAPEPQLGEFSREDLDCVEPEAGCRVKQMRLRRSS